MAKTKKKLLPKDFESLLQQGDLPKLKAVFDGCEIDARGGYSKRTALAFNDCPDELARWLIEQGADIEAPDTYGETPLHARAGHWQGRVGILLEFGADVGARDSRGDTPLHKAARVANPQTVRLLLDNGADSAALNSRQLTPLGLALEECVNARIPGVGQVAELLFAKPAPKPPGLLARLLGGASREPRIPPDLQAAVRRIGTEFEFHRANFNPESVEQVSEALERLYDLFEVPPVPPRAFHDGRSPIHAKATRWEDQHHELWSQLVPSSGAAQTVQGEVIRITGRISDEVERNGGVNWDDHYRHMGKALLHHLGSGVALSAAQRAEAADLVAGVRRTDGAARMLCRLAVEWVGLNPKPMPLPPPDYAR